MNDREDYRADWMPILEGDAMPQRPTERLDIVLGMFQEIKDDLKALRVEMANSNLASVRHDERLKVVEESHVRHRDEHKHITAWLFVSLIGLLGGAGAYIWKLVTGK